MPARSSWAGGTGSAVVPRTPGAASSRNSSADSAGTARRADRVHRLDISSSNFPRSDVNTNTGEPEARARRTATATNPVHMDARHPSHLRVWLEAGLSAPREDGPAC
ncbi:CocE/NonD family hydrolase C-terminal non-catalytic domain-containing protein [Streptomyces paradoxus]|uniref:CocE/NonD family hydrolase C-terminal non-catalytic domain-containing protein n=1 Tax=Streptomyces paradoxus TaxID=66375 RepID=UPI0037033712